MNLLILSLILTLACRAESQAGYQQVEHQYQQVDEGLYEDLDDVIPTTVTRVRPHTKWTYPQTAFTTLTTVTFATVTQRPFGDGVANPTAAQHGRPLASGSQGAGSWLVQQQLHYH